MAYPYSTQQITGTTREIKLELVYADDTFSAGQMYYKVDTVSPSYNTNTAPNAYGFTAINNAETLIINPDEYLTFSVVGTGTLGSTTAYIVNLSDEFKRIASFLVDIQNTPGGGVIPNAIDFINDSSNTGEASTNPETISGLGTGVSIDIRAVVDISGGPAFYDLYYVLNGQSVSFTNGDLITVTNSDTLRFVLYNPDPTSVTATVTLENTNDNDTVLDIFTLEAYTNV
jgi:hypothetical protein